VAALLTFCATPTCALYLLPDDPRVRGQGEWAHLPNGLVMGRTTVAGQRYCDLCARELIAGRAPSGLHLDTQ
jgi:hypothetical protein